MPTKIASQYTMVRLGQVMDDLTAWIEQTEDAIDMLESRDTLTDSQEDRLADLETRRDALQSALDALGEIE